MPAPAAPRARAASPVEAEVGRIRGCIERGEFAMALDAAEALRHEVPENRDVLYMRAVCLRNLNRIPEALAALDELQTHHSGFSLLYQERGHCQVMLRNAPAAIEAFMAAVTINPALPASWRTLASLYQMTGQAQNAATARAHVDTLAQLPTQVVTATGLFSDGDFLAAEAVIRPFLRKCGNHVEGMRLLARIGLALDVLDDAEALLEAVLRLAPDYRAARYDYALALLRRHKHTQALAELELLLQQDPGNRGYLTSFATAQVGLGRHAEALLLYRRLIEEAPPGAPLRAAPLSELHLSVAHSLKALGRQSEAIESYRAAAAVRADFGDAYWSLANLKTYRFTDEELARMCTIESQPAIATVDRLHLCFALGKALEDRGDYAQSFRYYERGNALKKAESQYRPETVERNKRLQMRICTAEFFAARQGVGCPDGAPIFIVGLPRSGSTLIEQILASHSQVEGTMELADIPRMVLELQGREAPGAVARSTRAPGELAPRAERQGEEPRYPRVLGELKLEVFRRLGESYINDTRAYRTDKPRFLDKMPNNFRHIGLLHLILPNAKIIDARRDAMACCFSNFKQLFAGGQEFTYSLEDLGRYYRDYLELMDHWDRVLPGKILRVQYERVVVDLAGEVRRLLDFCGLDFEPQCLEFYKTMRSVRTASSEQVRRPLNREGVDQWRHYEPWLGPLKQAVEWNR